MTFKERCDKIKKAATQFWNENKDILIVAGSFLAGTFVTYKIMKNVTPINEINVPQVNYTPPVLNIQTEPESKDDWDEETMRDNWDWVCELASNMEMGPDEEYHIYGDHCDAGGICIGDNVVSHMICGEEVYPDDVEEYEELYDPDNDTDDNEEEDEPEDEDEYIEIQVNENDPAVKDIVRKFVVLANSNSVSVRRKEND